MGRRGLRERFAIGSKGVAVASVLAFVAACQGGVTADPQASSDGPEGAVAETPDLPEIASYPVHGASGVTVDTVVEVSTEDATLSSVTVTDPEGATLPGEFADEGQLEWRSNEFLEPGMQYTVDAVATDAEGLTSSQTYTFTTDDLSSNEQIFASVAPLDGETVGVGMPIVVFFDIPVGDRVAAEERMAVTTSNATEGSWYWLSDTEAHWRPRDYWQPGTDVTVVIDHNGVELGAGLYGQNDREVSFSIGQSVRSVVDVDSYTMDVYVDGALARTIQISSGAEGSETRGGIKVIMEKHRYKTMDAATLGVAEDDPDYYRIEDVEYAMRVTYSGEFIHAAPWSAGSQGGNNVSNGCVGMSTEDAAWLFSVSSRGDVVEVVDAPRALEPGNGWTDWNLSWEEYQQGSAL